MNTWTADVKKSYKKEYDRRRHAAFKKSVLDFYGAKCSCCGEDNPGFLTIDHINNDGMQQRKERKGSTYWQQAVLDNFPDDLRIMCWNCNSGRQYNGGICPHVKKVSDFN